MVAHGAESKPTTASIVHPADGRAGRATPESAEYKRRAGSHSDDAWAATRATSRGGPGRHAVQPAGAHATGDLPPLCTGHRAGPSADTQHALAAGRPDAAEPRRQTGFLRTRRPPQTRTAAAAVIPCQPGTPCHRRARRQSAERGVAAHTGTADRAQRRAANCLAYRRAAGTAPGSPRASAAAQPRLALERPAQSRRYSSERHRPRKQ